MKLFIVILSCVVLFSKVDGQVELNVTKQELHDQVNQFISGMNIAPVNFRINAQTHFDNAVRTFMESLRGFSINANQAYFAAADTNRTTFQECLVHVRDTVDNVVEFLRKKALLPVFDFSASTETRIESDLKNQTDELKAAIDLQTNQTCLSSVGINMNSLATAYLGYSYALMSCIVPLTASTNGDILNKFNAEHFPALLLLNRISISLGSVRTRTQVITFMETYCNHTTILELHEVRTSAEEIVVYNSKDLSICYDKARAYLPDKTPYLEEVNKCTQIAEVENVSTVTELVKPDALTTNKTV